MTDRCRTRRHFPNAGERQSESAIPRLLILSTCFVLFLSASPSTRPAPADPFAERYRAYQQLVKDAHAALERRDYPAAIASLTKAVQMSPFVPSHYYHRGLAGYRLGNYSEAIEDFDKALILDGRLASAYLFRGLSRLKLSDYRRALEDYNAALGLNPDDPTSHNNLAWLYASAGEKRFRDKAKALEHARKAAQLTKEKNAEILDTLARACFINGMLHEAAEAEKKALQLDPENNTFKTNLQTYEQAASGQQPSHSTP